jgi:hypothetical protein
MLRTALLFVPLFGNLNGLLAAGRLIQPRQNTTYCNIGTGQDGVCMATSLCASEGGVSTAGHCPGPADIQVRRHSSDVLLPQIFARYTLRELTACLPWQKVLHLWLLLRRQYPWRLPAVVSLFRRRLHVGTLPRASWHPVLHVRDMQRQRCRGVLPAHIDLHGWLYLGSLCRAQQC